MRLLVNTHILLWVLVEPQKLSRTWQARLEAAENEILFSAVSIWELAIKLQIGRLVLPIELEGLMEAVKIIGFAELPVSAAHAAGVRHRPLYHRDPFDRLLVAQAIHEPAHLLTADRALGQYSTLIEVMV